MDAIFYNDFKATDVNSKVTVQSYGIEDITPYTYRYTDTIKATKEDESYKY